MKVCLLHYLFSIIKLFKKSVIKTEFYFHHASHLNKRSAIPEKLRQEGTISFQTGLPLAV